MDCKTCQKELEDCGCTSQGIHVSPPSECNTPTCPDPEECPEVISTQCIVNTETEDTLCEDEVVYSAGDTLAEIHSKITAYFCAKFGAIPAFVVSVTGDGVDNTDPQNPVITFPAAGVESVSGTFVDNTDPQNPVIIDRLESNKVFVDENGNDSTGTFETPAKPFATIQAAILNLEANTLAGSVSTVVVRPGTYVQGTVSLSTTHKINIYCEEGSVFTATNFRDLLGPVECSVTGYGVFFPTVYAFQINYANSNFIFKAKKIDASAGGSSRLFYTQVTSPTNLTTEKATVYAEVEELVYASGSSSLSSAAFNARSGSILHLKAKTIRIKSNGLGGNIRPTTSEENAGRVIIEADTLFLEPYTDASAWAMNFLNINNNEFSSSVYVKIKNTYIDAKSCTPSGFLCPVIIQGSVGHVKWVGDIQIKGLISQNLVFNAFPSISTGGTIFDFVGNIKSDISFIDYSIKNTDPNAKFNIEGNIKVTTETVSNVLVSGIGAEITLKNTNLESSAANSTVSVVNGGTFKAFSSNLKEITGTESIYDDATGGDVYLGNVVHNLPLNANVTLVSLPALHTEDVNLVLPSVNA